MALSERERRIKVEATDRQTLKNLTTMTLFCPHCYRPFLKSDGKVKSRLLLRTQYRSMVDYISAILFVVTLIAWMFSIYVLRFHSKISIRYMFACHPYPDSDR